MARVKLGHVIFFYRAVCMFALQEDARILDGLLLEPTNESIMAVIEEFGCGTTFQPDFSTTFFYFFTYMDMEREIVRLYSPIR